jgi:hypothetical protein
MICTDCKDSFVDYQEGRIDAARRCELEGHLAGCRECSEHYSAITQLHGTLEDHGRMAAGVSVVNRVMNQVRASQAKDDRPSPTISLLGNRLFRWAIGGAAAALAVSVGALFLSAPLSSASASEVMRRGINVARQLTSVHMQFQVRTSPSDNFSQIHPKAEFVPVELWKEFGPPLRWRVDKPGRVALMDGASTLLYLRSANAAMRIPQPSSSAFDTAWLHQIANIETALENELRIANSKGWKMSLTRETDASGAPKAVVTIEAKSGLPEGDYLQNKFFDTADTRRVFRFDDRTGRLELVQIYMRGAGSEVLIVEVDRIAYNQPIAAGVFQMDIPGNVAWIDHSKPLTTEPKYSAMTVQEAARTFFEACGREDWGEVAKFWPLPLDERLKQFFGGLQVVSLGEPFTSKGSSATFVPYEIRVHGEMRKHNLALKRNPTNGSWFIDGGL